MAKGRMINRSISIDPKFNSLTRDAQWLYMRMLPFMDDYGRITGNLFELKYQIIPSSEETPEWIHGQLLQMKQKKLIYFVLDKCVQFRGFEKNQKIGHRKAESKYADISEHTEKGKERSEKVSFGSNNIIEDNKIKDNKNKYKAKPKDLDMVISYFKEKNIPDYKLNAKKFWDHYEANGWIRGKTKIKQWKMCLSSWNFERGSSSNANISSFESKFKKTPTDLYIAFCSKCKKKEMPNNKWQLREGSSCCRVEYVPEV
jgi:hypothetical protein